MQNHIDPRVRKKMADRLTLIEKLMQRLYPGADVSRGANTRRILDSMREDQLESVTKSLDIGTKESKFSIVRDFIESQDNLSLYYTAKWGTVVPVSEFEKHLTEQFSEISSGRNYDIYSDEFEAHVKAYMMYHQSCGGSCAPYDRDDEEDYFEGAMEVPQSGHYKDYFQDYDLVELVEKHPEHVSELVLYAVERRGITDEIAEKIVTGQSTPLTVGQL